MPKKTPTPPRKPGQRSDNSGHRSPKKAAAAKVAHRVKPRVPVVVKLSLGCGHRASLTFPPDTTFEKLIGLMPEKPPACLTCIRKARLLAATTRKVA